MQNWNQWQLPVAPVTAPMPQPPIGYAAPGADPMATMQAYMQYYNQPAPSGYTAEQWSAAQQQNWAQWQTWQQQYQQWQAQYGEKYQETMKQMSAQGLTGIAPIPLTPMGQPPPLPKEDTSVKPPLPPDNTAQNFTGIPPPHQNNLPLFPSKRSANPPLPPGQPPMPAENNKRSANSNAETGSVKKIRGEDDELTEAEKTFDAQFKQWEEQFNKWKQQNANHPDKTQYKQYEAKWTSWREKLIERREQMRRKREQQKQASAKTDSDKNKPMSGDDKILNILSSTENQGLINNLLGIGKTLGLTGKQDVPDPSIGKSPAAVDPTPLEPPTMTPNMNQAAWAAQQWAAQYNAGMNMTNYAVGYQTSSVPPPNVKVQPAPNFNQMPPNFNHPPGNFNQPPPNLTASGPNMPNAPGSGSDFSQPPPGFGGSNFRQQSNSTQSLGQGQRPGQGASQESNNRSFRTDLDQRQAPPSSRDSVGSGNDRYSFDGNRFAEPPPNERSTMNAGDQFGRNENYGHDGPNKDFGAGSQGPQGGDNFKRDNRDNRDNRDFGSGGRSGNEFRPNNNNDRFGSGFDRSQGDRFGRDGDRQGERGNNRFNSDRDNLNQDPFNSSGDRFNSSNDRFGSGNDDTRPGDSFRPSNDRFGSGNDSFGPSSGDRFGGPNDRSSRDRFGSSNEKFGRPPPDRFDSRDGSRDSFGSSSRGGGRNNQFEPPNDMAPELKKLMEKRKSAIGVFKSSNFSPFLDSDKNINNSSSLSESFRKITGDSPFSSRSFNDFGNKDSFGPRGLPQGPPGPGGSGNFDSTRDLHHGNVTDYKSQGQGDFRRGNEFSPRGLDGSGGPNRSGDMPPRKGNEFPPRMRNEFEQSRSEPEQQRDNFRPDYRGSDLENPERMLRPPMQTSVVDESKDIKDNFKDHVTAPIDSSADPAKQNIPPLAAPPWMQSDFAEDEIIETPVDEMSTLPSSKPLEDNLPVESGLVEGDAKSHDVGDQFKNKSDALPFMGENDPIPEDLNMEPPPELPNLGPVIKDSDRSFNQRGQNLSGPFGPPSGDIDSRSPFDGSFGPRDMQMGSRSPVPPFGPNRPNDSRFPPFGPPNVGPRGPQDDRINNRGPASLPPGPRGPGNFGPRGSENFDSRGPGKFGPSGPGDIEPRGPGNFGLRGPGDFGPRGPSDFGPRGPGNFGPRGPTDFGPRGPTDFGPRGPGNFGPRGPGNLGPRGPGDVGPQGPGGFGPQGPGGFGPQGPGDFGPQGPGDFGPQGPGDFGPQGPGDFSPRGPGNFGPRGPGDFGPRDSGDFSRQGPADFGSRGPGNFGAQGSGNFGPRGPGEFGSQGSGNFGPRGPGNFGPRGPGNFGPRGPPDFGQRDSSDFGPRGPGDFGPRGSIDGQFGPRDPGDRPFGPHGPPDGPMGTSGPPFVPKGNVDDKRTNIPSLMSFKFEPPKNNGPNDMAPQGNKGLNDLPLAFRSGDQDQRPFGGDQDRMDQDHSNVPNTPGPRSCGGPDWKQPMMRNKFGDLDQRTGPGDFSGGPPMGPNIMGADRDTHQSGLRDLTKNRPCGPDERMKIMEQGDTSINPGSDIDDKKRGAGANFSTRRTDGGTGPAHRGPPKEFCIEKQFNYNHGTGVADEILSEYTPGKVIDYAHAARVIVHDYVTPAQCFDYGHGRLKPLVPEHQMHPKKDFRNWVENEKNLKEYTDRMRVYETELMALNRGLRDRLAEPSGHVREPSWAQEERRPHERERREALRRNDRMRRGREMGDHKERDRDRAMRERGRTEKDRELERTANKQHREDQAHQRRSNSRDRTRDRPEKLITEAHKENDKDDERSTGNVSGQESSVKKSTESTNQDNSKQQKEIKNVEPEVSAESYESPNIAEPPKTMELPKTPNFTMVDDLLCPPGRQNRPPKIVVILRGPPGSGKSFIAKLIKDKEAEQGGSAPRILSLDDYFLTEKETETEDDNGKKVTTKEMVYEYEEAMEPSYLTSLVKAFKKNITDGFFNFIILDSINEKISDYEEMWSFAKTKGFRVYVCEMEMDVQICLKRNIHNRTEDEINRIVDYFEPTPGHHQKLDVTSMLQQEAIEDVQMEDISEEKDPQVPANEDSGDSQEDPQDSACISKWERMEAEDKLDRLDGLKRKTDNHPQTMEDFLQVPDYYDMEDTSGKKRVRWADLEERKKQEKMRAVGFVVGQTNWDRMMDPTMGSSALTRTKYI